jgi:protein-disulfide isomerase
MALVRGLAGRYVVRAALLVIMVTSVARAAADAPPARPPASPPATVLVRGRSGFALGSARARVVVVEFSDYQCPFCRRYYASVFPRLEADYVATGKVRYVVRDLPLDIHSDAFAAAEAARCAGAAGKFWPVRNALLAGKGPLDRARFLAVAREAAVPEAAFKACLDEHRFAADIRRDQADAAAAGLDATPAFVIGTLGPEGVTGLTFVGARPYRSFANRIEYLLRAP